MDIWNILRPFGTVNGEFGNLVAIWYILPRFGIFCQGKSGNPCVGWQFFKRNEFRFLELVASLQTGFSLQRGHSSRRRQ
jgi:hypothetical protein